MKNLDLLESQPSINNRAHQLFHTGTEFLRHHDENISLLANIPESDLSLLMRKAKAVRFVKEETISSKINPNSLIVIFYGIASICPFLSGDQENVTVNIKEPGPDFGEIGLISDISDTISTVSLKNALFAQISKSEFQDWFTNFQNNRSVSVPNLAVKLNS